MNTKGSKKARKDFFTGMGFILPSLLGFLIFTFIPVVISLCLSFTSWNFREYPKVCVNLQTDVR